MLRGTKSILFFIFLSFALLSKAKCDPCFTSQKLYFIENKGQVKDQYGNPRNDIQYVVPAQGIAVFIGNGQLHYQFSHRDVCLPFQSPAAYPANKKSKKNIPSSDMETYRMDVTLAGANRHVEVIAGEQQPYYERYYLQGCINGVQAHTYKKITYKNVYPDIDWVICVNGDLLEHEFIVGPKGDASMIRLNYNGAASLKINNDGSITATTPMGTVKEQAPACYSVSGSRIPAAFKLHNNVLSYDVGISAGLVIDPVLEWGTYYGPDSSSTMFYDVFCDNAANVYACGLTWASNAIATTGSFHAAFAGGTTDAYLVKFDSSGNRLWSTYYGGSAQDWATAGVCDLTGNIYLAGATNSDTGIATPGCQLSTYIGGRTVGFLAKFSAVGIRQWGTYVGGCLGVDFDVDIASVSCDLSGHVYISGATDDTLNIATPGSFKTKKLEGSDSTDCFLSQYNTTGMLQWSTYYGGYGDEYGGAHCSDGYYVYLSGYTSTDTGTAIATPGSYQPTFAGGGTDAFLVKFDNTGNRVWGTYYGGNGVETAGGIACDNSGGIYLLGSTSSDTGIASPGCFQPLRGGVTDAFVAKFIPETGFRLWGTYYGGPGYENVDGSRIITDSDGVYVTGYTNSTAGIASAGAWQTVYGGGDQDAFFAKYSSAGIQQWGTYYGGTGLDIGMACAFDGKSAYLCGKTNSTGNIATEGSFLDAGGGATFYYQGFLAKFSEGPPLSVNSGAMPKEKMSISPNPNNGSFTLCAALKEIDGIAAITVTDMTGRVIMKDEGIIYNGTVRKQVDLDNSIPPGEYFLTVVSGDKINVLRFMKK